MHARLHIALSALALVAGAAACSGQGGSGSNGNENQNHNHGSDAGVPPDGSSPPRDTGVDPPPPSCDPAPGGGSATVEEPELWLTLADRWHEGWLASPAVADLDGDGVP